MILALFALSLDLILGYAGIVSLGHAAFFGIGAYAAGLLAMHGIVTEPVLGLARRRARGAVLGFVTSFLVLRGSDLTRLMVTLGVALMLRRARQPLLRHHRRRRRPAGRRDGAGPRPVRVRHVRPAPPIVYSLAVLFVLFLLARRIVNSPFGLSLRAIKRQSAARRRDRHAGQPAPDRDLHAGGAMPASPARCSTQTTQFASLDVFAFQRSADLLLMLVIGGTGYLYGG